METLAPVFALFFVCLKRKKGRRKKTDIDARYFFVHAMVTRLYENYEIGKMAMEEWCL